MYLIGLTGSIGMGKSLTASLFQKQGVPVYDADAAVHALYEKDGAAVAPIGALVPDNEAAGTKAVVLDIPLLLEGGGEKFVDSVVVVSAPYELQRQRVLARPGMSEERFADILAKQVPDAEKRKRAEFIVDSSISVEDAEAQVRAILDAIEGRVGAAYAARKARV